MKQKIAIIFGGNSPEYEVSLQSATAIIESIDNKKYDKILIGITRKGAWYNYYGEVKNIADDTWHTYMDKCKSVVISPDPSIHGLVELNEYGNKVIRVDKIFPVLHGKNGEDGTVQGLIELAGITIIGCGTLSSAICMDKDKAHKLVKDAGVEVPTAVVLNKKLDARELEKETNMLKYPVFVKPVKAGSSMGISKVYEKNKLIEAVDIAFNYDNQVIIEENIYGFEVGCAVLGKDELIIGAVDEIELQDGFLDFEQKYHRTTAKIHMPARIDKEIASKIQNVAKIIYKALECQGFARVDMFLTPDERIVFNEVNSIPGFTDCSRYPNMLKGIGMTYEEIVNKLIKDS